ncbi:MAG: peptidoglycan DD-metalloendopeptidase family protein [Pseudomonadota bacterium]
MNGSWKRRVVFWALPVAFGTGFGAGSLATRVTTVPQPPLQLAHHLPDIQDLGTNAAPAVGHPVSRIDAGPTPLRPSIVLPSPENLREPPQRAILLASTATRMLLPENPTDEAPPLVVLPDEATALAAEPTRESPGEDSLVQTASLTPAMLAVPATPPVEQITVGRGDTLSKILDRAEIDPAQAYAAVESLRDVYDPRRLKVGQELLITAAAADDGETGRRLVSLALDLDFDHQIRVVRDADGHYSAGKHERAQHRELVLRSGTIDDSLFLSADRADVPRGTTVNMIRLFSWDVDFQRDIRAGDGFEMLFEEVSLEDQADAVRGGDLLYAGLSLSGETLDAFRFEPEPGEVEYFDRTGRSLRKFLLRTPIDGARLSSGFGMRKHPILGYSRMHKGVDFAAPTGTPIYAAGSGRVIQAGRKGGYGNYIRVRHSGEYHTAYAHLSRFAKGIGPGKRVRQGQVIGYVGSTGRSTGPHLHYEVLRNDKQVNPLKVKQPPNTKLAGAVLERFHQEVARIDRLRGSLNSDTQIASSSPEATVQPAAGIH